MSCHSLCFSFAQFVLPMPIVHTLACTGIFFVFLLDYLMFGNTITCKQGLGIGLGIFGSLLVSNSTLLKRILDPSYTYHTEFENYLTSDPWMITGFSLAFLLIMIAWAFGIVITKKAEANTFQINFNLGFCFIVSGSIAYPFLKSHTSAYHLIIAFFVSGLPMLLAQTLVNGALTMVRNTGVLNLTNFFSVIVSYFVSFFRYDENTNVFGCFGAFLIFFGVWHTITNQNK